MKILFVICLSTTPIVASCIHEARREPIQRVTTDHETEARAEDTNARGDATATTSIGGDAVRASGPSASNKSYVEDANAELTERVRHALLVSPLLSELAKHVLIVSLDGVVTLTGAVEHEGDQAEYRKIVPAVVGVERLEDLTTVQP